MMAGDTRTPEGPARRVSFSELLGGRHRIAHSTPDPFVENRKQRGPFGGAKPRRVLRRCPTRVLEICGELVESLDRDCGARSEPNA